MAVTITPFRDLVNTLTGFIRQQIPAVLTCVEGYPDSKFLELDNSLPGVYLMFPSARPTLSRGRYYDFGDEIPSVVGSSTVQHVLNKREYMVQAYVIGNTKAEVVLIGDLLWTQLSQQWYLPLQTYQQNTLLTPTDDKMLTTGEETQFHRRLIVFGATLRELAQDTGPAQQSFDWNNTFQR